AEVGDKILTDFSRTVGPAISWHYADREQHLPALLLFLGACIRNLRLDPIAVHSVGGQDQWQLVVQTDGFIDLLVDFFPALDVMGSEPASDTLRLQVCVEAIGELLILGRVADEARVEIEWRANQRLRVG